MNYSHVYRYTARAVNGPRQRVPSEVDGFHVQYSLTAARGFRYTNSQDALPNRVVQRSGQPTIAVNNKVNEFTLPSKQKRTNRSCKGKPSTTDSNFEPDVSIPGMTVLISGSGWIRKSIWGIAVTFCFVFCFVQVRRLLVEFWNVPITVDVDIFRDENPLFPAITVCPYQPFRYNKLLQERLWAMEKKRTNLTFAMNLVFPFFSLLQLPDENVTNLWQYGRVREGDVRDKLLCKSFSTAMNCELKVIRKDIVTYSGFCTSYTLSDRIKYDGPYNGFSLFYYVHGNVGEHHYTVIFHHPADDPTHFLYKESGSTVESFIRTFILYTRQAFHNVNTARRPCWPREKVLDCYRKCVEQSITQNATCRLPYMTTSTLPLCTTPESADNTYSVTLQVYRRMDELCRHCPRRCQEDIYRLSVTTLTQHNFTLLTFHMIDNVVQVVTEKTPYTFDKVLSDIGGILGLFMGVCLLTGLQLLEAMFLRIKLKFSSI